MSLLAYGQGMLAGDIGVGAGLTEPWAIRDPHYIWSGESLMDGEKESDSSNVGSDAPTNFLLNGHHFLSLLAEEAPEDVASEDPETPGPIRRELHWDSPPQSPGAVFDHLPFSVLQIVDASSKADLVAVGIVQRNAEHLVETLLSEPKHLSSGLSFPDLFEFTAELHARVNGTVEYVGGSNLQKNSLRSSESSQRHFLGATSSWKRMRAFSLGYGRIVQRFLLLRRLFFLRLCIRCPCYSQHASRHASMSAWGNDLMQS